MTMKRELRRNDLKQLIEKVRLLSPFELKDEFIKMAEKSKKWTKNPILNAGRGNPNWTASTPRQAFFTLGQFAVEETQLTWCEGDLAGMPQKKGVYERFLNYANQHKDAPGMELLKKVVEYGILEHQFDADAWVFELVDGIIGDNYPVPDRMLIHLEQVVKDYLIKEMGGNPKTSTHELFAVEGGTAAMCYIFDSLKQNQLLKPKDKIALFVPIFTPYVEIANLPSNEFEIVMIHASEVNEAGVPTWQYPKEELDKLKDTSIKLACIVNPSNPPAVAMSEESMAYLNEIVTEHHPKLMIVTDDVYGTFCDGFKSLMVTMPYHTLGVYSYSKYFGVTGWRLGVIALAKENVYNELISQLPTEEKRLLHRRYEALTTTPHQISFIDRIVADSRHVALNHTAGLSTPQQVQMAIFSVFALLDVKNKYKEQTKAICRRREQLICDELKAYPSVLNKLNTSYYNKYDLLVWAKFKYGEAFATYLENERSALEFLFDLSHRYGIVLLNGSGFEGPAWSIRVSLANLNDSDYEKVGQAINELFDEYANDWHLSQKVSV
ncbi:MAG: aspartate 4-decarboxylase [Turicibacter sp.]|nr:aspartate 4-decarboxylase [Turicibacter sp.]